MEREAELVKQARATIAVSPSEMADLVGLDEAKVKALESGEVDATTEQLDRYARVFGLNLRRFLAGGAERAAPTLLLRSLREDGPSFAYLLETRASGVLGEFLRCASDSAELESLLGETDDRLAKELGGLEARPLRQEREDFYRQAEQMALEVRERLGLGIGVVPSMLELLQERLGISIFWVGPDELDRDIDGASAYSPTPTILVNLVGGAECWWRSRMTLAHEFCHLLFDLNNPGQMTNGAFLFSPIRGKASKTRRVQLPTDLEEIERRAGVFAAYFLAPRKGVEAAVGQLAPTSDEAINAVCRQFEVGRQTAISQLKNIYRLSDEQWQSMRDRSPTDVLSKQHPDAAVRLGLRSGRLQDLVARAFAKGHVGKTSARRYLGLSSSEPLPPVGGLSESERAPLHTPERRAELVGQRYLAEHSGFAGCYVAGVTRASDRFRLDVAHADELNGETPQSRGHMMISAGFEVIDNESSLVPASTTG